MTQLQRWRRALQMLPGQKIRQQREVRGAIPMNLHQGVTLLGGNEPRHGKLRRGFSQMRQHGSQAPSAARLDLLIQDFENEPTAVRAVEAQIAISFSA
jgi:hypothetical protein